MSYDLQVYASRGLAGPELAALLTTGDLTVAEPDQAGSLTVVRGRRRTYSFTVSEALPIEQEDVPDEVTAAVLEPRFLYELLVEGSSPTEVPHAVRAARRLAAGAGGAVLDQQTGQVWSRGRLRSVDPVPTGRTSTVDISWYVREGSDAHAAASAWLRLARAHLPEALPRRYGTVEPLRHTLDGGGDEAFTEFVSGADGTVFFTGRPPVVSGHLAAGPGYRRTITRHSLTLLADPLRASPAWRAAARRLFVEVARESEAIVATAEVVRGVDWSGRSIGYDSRTERDVRLWSGTGWAGLPPYPVWWCWFGPEYTPLVADHLDPARTEPVDDALVLWASELPLDRDALAPAAPGRVPGLLRRLRRRHRPTPARSWLPPELLLSVDDSDPSVWNPPSRPAAVRPPSLT